MLAAYLLVALMAMSDDDVSTALDYLGRDQPLGSKRVTSLAAAGGGGNVTAPVTSAADPGQRVQGSPGGGLSKQPSTSGSLQDLQKAMSALGFSEKVLKLASPGAAPTPTFPSATAANLGHEATIHDLGLDPGQFNELSEQGFGMASQAELHGATLGAEAGAEAGAETATTTTAAEGGSTLGAVSSGLSTVLPYLQAAYDIYGRSEQNMEPGGQAALAAIELAGAALAPATAGMSFVFGSLLANVLGDEFTSLTHAQREALDQSATGAGFRDLYPRLAGAQSIDDMVEALQARAGGWGMGGDHTITLNGTPLSDRAGLGAALHGGLADPSQIKLNWNQGLSEDMRAPLETTLNAAVRQQLAVLRARDLGYAPAADYLRQGKGHRAEYLLGQDGLLQPEMNEGTPTGEWGSSDWARVQGYLDDMRAAGLDPDARGLVGMRERAARGGPAPAYHPSIGGDGAPGAGVSDGPDAGAGPSGGDSGDE